MRIAHLIWSLDIGGSEAMLVDIVNRQAKSNEVAVIVGNSVVNDDVLAGLSSDVAVLRVGRHPGSRNPWHIYRMRRDVQRYRPHIVHLHHPSLISALPLVSAKKVLTVHDTGMRFSRSVKRFDLVASISLAVKADLAGRALRLPSTLVYNGIDFSAIAPRRWGSGSRPFRIVQVSRLLLEKKGQDILLKAVRIVSEKRGSGLIHVDFIGDGPDRERITGLASQLGVADHCRFLGAMPRSEVYKNLPTYDLLVQPSRYEGFGLTVVEGVAACVAVLASDLAGPREILGHVGRRYLFAPNQPEECAQQILQIIEDCEKPDFQGQLIANREALRTHFDIDATANAYLREYERLLHDG